MSKIVQSHNSLVKYVQSKNIDLGGEQIDIESKFTSKIPEFYLGKINWQKTSDPLRLMSFPDARERDIRSYEMADPIGDEPNLAVKNLVHRYPDRVLFLLTNNCQINCRFCFRRELTHHSTQPDLDQVVSYLDQHPEVKEVIFSGGDPLSLSAKYLEKVFNRLSQIPHLKIFRFHTRIPVVNPDHVGTTYLELFEKMAKNHQLVIALHVNHPQEFSPELEALTKKLSRSGTLLLSQTVLLKNINNNIKTLEELFRGLIEIGVKPYYLHHPDLVKGTHHFRVSIKEGKEIFRSLRGNLSGVCQPEYVLDLPGGKGKVPVMWLRKKKPGEYEVENFKGEIVTYIDPLSGSKQ